MRWNTEKVFGVIFIAIGIGILYTFVVFLHHDVSLPKEKIGLAYSGNIDLSNIFFRFNTVTSPEILRIDYSLLRSMDKTGFIIIVLPYEGKLTVAKEGWQEETIDSRHTTILYKKFASSNNTNITNDQDNIYFILNNPVESFIFPTSYVHIPFFSNPLDADLTVPINGITNGTIFNSWDKISGPAEVSVIFSNAYDSWNTQPVADLTSTENNIVVHWKITSNDPLYVLDFTSSNLRLIGSIVQTLGGVLLGSGFGLLVAGKTRERGEENQKNLKKFIADSGNQQLATLFFNTKNYEGARKYYDLALTGTVEDIPRLTNIGASLFELKQYKEALYYFNKILELDKINLIALSNKATCLAKLGDNNGALPFFDEALQLNPDFVDTLNNKGASLIDLGRDEEALECFEKILKKNSGDVMALTNKGKALKNIAMRLSGSGKRDEAVEKVNEARSCYNKALEIQPNSDLTLTALGHLLYDLGTYAEALSCFQRSLKIDPLNVGSLYNFAVTLLKMGRLKDALQYFDEYLILKPTDINALNDKGVTLSRLNKEMEAIECFNKILVIDPTNADALHNKEISIEHYLLKLKRY